MWSKLLAWPFIARVEACKTIWRSILVHLKIIFERKKKRANYEAHIVQI
jgi:hypothetical protein